MIDETAERMGRHGVVDPAGTRVDVHQHLWPEPFLDALRARRRPPRLDGWILLLEGEPPFAVDPFAHDPAQRAEEADSEGLDLVLVAASAALGIADLPAQEGEALAAAWHEGALELPDPFRPWATTGLREPDPAALEDALRAGCIGLELPASALASPAAVEELGPLLAPLEQAGAPLLIHPGPVRGSARDAPGWWPPVVDYVQQLHAAWWAWWQAGRSGFPGLRVCFSALAGLAPLHQERHRARGGEDRPVDPAVFLETSTYGPRAVDATIRALGVDVICHGSDRPYARPADLSMGDSVAHALRVGNPARMLARVPSEVKPA